MKNIFIEAGINHFGNLKEANKILSWFLKSKFSNITYMLQTNEFYQNQEKFFGIDFKLEKNFYRSAIKKCHKKNKKIGLAVCRLKTYQNLIDLNFDFFKLLGLGIDQKDLINQIKKKKKPVFISTGFNASDSKIKKCISTFGTNKKINLLYSPMTYDLNEINLDKINYYKKKFKKPVGFSNHTDNKDVLNILTAYKPDYLFIYCKSIYKRNRIYPDDKHAFFFNEINKIVSNYLKYIKMAYSKKKIKKIKIFANEFKK